MESKNFFNEDSSLPCNESIVEKRNIKNIIFENYAKFIQNPKCTLYYITTGKWTADQTIVATSENGKEELKGTNLFSTVDIKMIDASKLISFYKSTLGKKIKTINTHFDTAIPCDDPEINAYIQIVKCLDYCELISNEEGNIDKFIFYENVRSFLGDNKVNIEIEETIGNAQQHNYFALFNNGITVVAKNIKRGPTSITITDFQIVNGCQTSYILHRNKEKLSESAYIPIKFVSTENQTVIDQIIKATNRQTEVKLEAFEALSKFHKELEDYYFAMNTKVKNRIFYERRTNQYTNDNDIVSTQIISLPLQLNSFISMFYEDPHSTHRYYGNLLKRSYSGRVFLPSHNKIYYYTSAYAFNRITFWIKKNKITDLFKYKYHVMLILKLLACKSKTYNFDSRNDPNDIMNILKIVEDKKKMDELFSYSKYIINDILHETGIERRDGYCKREITDHILSRCSG